MHEVGTHGYKEKVIGNSSIKNFIVEIKNAIDALNGRINSAKEQTGKLEDRINAKW